MSLTEKLNSIREQSAGRIPEDIAAIMHRATEDLRSSGILDSVIKIGEKLPDFDLLNQRGIPVSSSSSVGRGTLVLTFFRGSW